MSSTPMLLDDAEGIRKHNPLIDALPYADVLPPDWRPLADRMVQEEMRRMTKRPKDYLAEMKPAYEMTYKDCPMIKKEMERVEKGIMKMPPPDSTRYSLPPPPKSKRDDPEAWEAAVKNAKAQLEHQTLRIQNLELMLKYGPNQWRAYNASLEAAIKRCARAASDVRFIRGEARSRERWGTLNFDLSPPREKKTPPPPADRSIPVLTARPHLSRPRRVRVDREIAEQKAATAELNARRKLRQTAVGEKLQKLEREFYEGCRKNAERDFAIKKLEAEKRAREGEETAKETETAAEGNEEEGGRPKRRRR